MELLLIGAYLSSIQSSKDFFPNLWSKFLVFFEMTILLLTFKCEG